MIKWGTRYYRSRIRIVNNTLAGLLLLIFCVGVQAQQKDWQQGWLVPKNGDTLHGSIQYDFSKDIVQVKVSNKLKTFTAYNTEVFAVQQPETDTFRLFKTVETSSGGDYKVPRFFETPVYGHLDLLIREQYVRETYSRYDPFTGMSYPVSNTRRVFDYHIRFPNDKIKQLREPTRKQVLDLLPAYRETMKKFIKKHKLRAYRREDMIRIIEYYNELAA